MLLYLDQAQSNERRLMDLHTLIVDAGYNQNDVRELVRSNLNESRDLPAHHDYLTVLAQVLRVKFAMTIVNAQYAAKH